MKNYPLVSIIIPTLNSEKTLGKCLKSINSQSYQNYETIIVDGGSDDKTVKIAEKFGANIINANIKSMTKQTNIGISNSTGHYIYRVDSDVILPPKIVEKSVEKCENDGFDGVCIFWVPDESISFWAKVRKIEKESYIEYPNYIGAIKYNKNVLGARFLRRDVIESVGRFDEDIPTLGEDYALYNKLAKSDFQFALINLRESHIGEPRNIMDILRKNYNYGLAMKSFLKEKETKNGIQQFSPIGRKYLIKAFKKALKQNIILFFGLILYLFMVYTSTFVGFSYSAIRKVKNED